MRLAQTREGPLQEFLGLELSWPVHVKEELGLREAVLSGGARQDGFSAVTPQQPTRRRRRCGAVKILLVERESALLQVNNSQAQKPRSLRLSASRAE